MLAFFAIGYAIAYFMIGRFSFATPGRLGNYTDDTASDDSASDSKNSANRTAAGSAADMANGSASSTANSPAAGTAGNASSKAERIIALLGGRENIVLVDACMTRLRVTVRDVSKVAETAAWKAEGAMGLIKKGEGIQAVYGPKADVLKSDINDAL